MSDSSDESLDIKAAGNIPNSITIPRKLIKLFRRHIKIYQFLAQRLVYLDEVPLDDGTVMIMSYRTDHEFWKFLKYLPWSAIDDAVQKRIMVVDGQHDKLLVRWLSLPSIAFCVEMHHKVIVWLKQLKNGMIQ